jgi:hypothetical protein
VQGAPVHTLPAEPNRNAPAEPPAQIAIEPLAQIAIEPLAPVPSEPAAHLAGQSAPHVAAEPLVHVATEPPAAPTWEAPTTYLPQAPPSPPPTVPVAQAPFVAQHPPVAVAQAESVPAAPAVREVPVAPERAAFPDVATDVPAARPPAMIQLSTPAPSAPAAPIAPVHEASPAALYAVPDRDAAPGHDDPAPTHAGATPVHAEPVPASVPVGPQARAHAGNRACSQELSTSLLFPAPALEQAQASVAVVAAEVSPAAPAEPALEVQQAPDAVLTTEPEPEVEVEPKVEAREAHHTQEQPAMSAAGAEPRAVSPAAGVVPTTALSTVEPLAVDESEQPTAEFEPVPRDSATGFAQQDPSAVGLAAPALAAPAERRPRRSGRLWFWLPGLVAIALAAATGAWTYEGGHILVMATPSMGTTAPAGSLVLTRPLGTRALHTGMLVAFHVPATGELYMHRISAIGANGKFRTRGDLNGFEDGWELTRRNVVGVPTTIVPDLGWAVKGLPWALAALVVGLILARLLPRMLRPAARAVAAGAAIAVPVYMVRPFARLVVVSTRHLPGGSASHARNNFVARLINGGAVPLRVTLHGAQVTIQPGHASVLAARLASHADSTLSAHPLLPIWFWPVLGLVVLAPLVLGMLSLRGERRSEGVPARGTAATAASDQWPGTHQLALH